MLLLYCSDTHDKLKCERCKIIVDDAEVEAKKVLPKKLAACRELLQELMALEDSCKYHVRLAYYYHFSSAVIHICLSL